MRFLNSLRNSALAFAGQIITIVLGFVLRWYFVHILGQEYLGVNSVMESMIALLSMTELGIGTSVAFALYKPIAQGDEKRIGALMAFYRKVYHVIGIVTAAVGPLLIPFMRFFTREAVDVPYVNLIYLMFLANTVLSYFFAYKRTLLSAYQQNYVNSVTEDLFAVIKYIFQGVAIVVYKSYIGYLAVSIVCALATNIVISVVCDRKYPFVKNYRKEKLLPEDRAGLKKSVVSLMYQKIGAKLVTGTDNLMISYARLSLMGIYSNYAMVISIITRVVYNVLRSILGSIGNLVVQEDSGRKCAVYDEFTFASFSFHLLMAMGLSACLERFIVIWAGEGWLLSPAVTLLVVMNFFLHGLREPNVVIIEAAGLFNKMRMKAVGEVVVNLVVSFLFLIVFDMGIYGVLLGTTVSMVSVCIWWEILAVHKYALNASAKKTAGRFVCHVATAATGCFASYFISEAIPIGGIWGLLLSGVCAAALFGLIVIGLYGRTMAFRGLWNRFAERRRG